MDNHRVHGAAGSASGVGPRLREDFDLQDANRDGRLTLGEFMRMIDRSDAEMSAEECQNAFDEIDADHDGLIDFAQLQVWWNEQTW